MDIDYKAIGKRIKIARIRKDITQEKLADRIGISPSHLSNIETGNTRVSLVTIVKIANLLGASVDELLSENVVRSNVVFREEIQEILSDCDDYEIRLMAEIVAATKKALRHEAMLRQVDVLE